jgi:hypothetical protein
MTTNQLVELGNVSEETKDPGSGPSESPGSLMGLLIA